MKKLFFLSAMLISVLTVIAQPPVITSFSPTSGPVGTTVTITGSNFSPVAANNIVYFGAVKATVPAATNTSLTVIVPAGATYEPITVTAGVLTAYSSKPFTVTFASNSTGFTAGSFAPKVDFPASDGPRDVAIVDLDGDGKSDLVSTNINTNSISVLRNTTTNNTLAFTQKQDFPTGTQPFGIDYGDLDGDGKPDLAVANLGSGTVSLFRNISTTGTIAFVPRLDLSGIAEAYRLSIGDLDSDGKPDLVVISLTGLISVFRNISTGTGLAFAPKVEYATGSQSLKVAIGDLDGDGKPDLAVANNGARTVSLFRNISTNGTIAFAAKIDYPVLTNPSQVAIGDVDGDGKQDIVISSSSNQPSSGTISVLRNTSTPGTLSFAARVDFATTVPAQFMGFGDLDGDGKPDVVVSFPLSSSVSILKNLSTPGMPAFASGVNYTVSSGLFNAAIADLNGDNLPDIALPNASLNTVTVLVNQGFFTPQPPVITSFSPASGPVGTSVTITGTNFDPVAANNIVYFGTAKATVTAATSTTLTVPVPAGATYAPISVTTNNLTAYSSLPFNVTFSNSCPGFVSGSFSGPSTFPAGGDPRNLATADLDGDGKADIAETNIASNTVSVFRNTRINGTITLAPKIDFATGTGPERVTIADYDGDGKPDMAIANGGSGTVSVFRNTSTPGVISFAAKTDYSAGSASHGVASGDFDGNGKPDLVVANTNSGTISFFKNNSSPGTISFGDKIDYATGAGPHAIAVGDLDADLKPDVTVANLSSNTVSVFKNTSTGGAISFNPKVDYALAGSNSFGIAIGDLDGDGKPELTTSSLTPGTVSVFRNTSTTGTIALAARIDYPVAYAPLNVAISDLDEDGKPDLAVSDFVSYNFSVLRNISTVGTISLGGEIAYGAGTPSTNIVLVDLDGDGRPDVATSAYSFNSLTVFRNQVACAGNCTPPTFNRQVVVDASCGQSNGRLLLTPTSGTAPYQYSLNGGTTYISGPDAGYTFENLSPGTYQLRIKDAGGCESAIVQQVLGSGCPLPCTPPTFLNNGTIVKAPTCGVNNGSVYLIPTSGAAPFQYSKDGGQTYVSGPANLFVFTGLAQGIYQLRIKDASGCESAVVSKVVAALNCPISSLPPASTNCTTVPTFLNNGFIVKAATCGRSDGGIYLIPTAGTAPFLYSINGGQSYFLGPDDGRGFQELPAGSYQLRIRDAKGCESAVVQRVVPSGCAATQTTISKQEAIRNSSSYTVLVYPNPTAGKFRLQLRGLASQKVQVQVVNSNGAVIEQRSVNASEESTVEFNLTGKAKGLYLVRVMGEKGVQVSKVLIQ